MKFDQQVPLQRLRQDVHRILSLFIKFYHENILQIDLYDFLGTPNLASVSFLNTLELKNLKYNQRFSLSFYLSCER